MKKNPLGSVLSKSAMKAIHGGRQKNCDLTLRCGNQILSCPDLTIACSGQGPNSISCLVITPWGTTNFTQSCGGQS